MTEKKDTRFQPGQSGNPAGRPPGCGTLSALRRRIRDDLESVIERLIVQAKAGDTSAARLLVERVMPPMRAESASVQIQGLNPAGTLVEQGQAVVSAIADGSLPPDVGAGLLQGLGSVARLREFEELERRIAALEGGQT